MLQLTVWALAPLVAAIVACATAGRLWPRRELPGVDALLGLCVCVAVWSIGQMIGIAHTDLAWKRGSIVMQTPGIAMLPVCWLAFAITYARQVPRLSWTALLALSALPLATIVVAAVPALQPLLWRDLELRQIMDFTGMTLVQGPWYYLMLVYSFALVGVGTVILAFVLSESRRHGRALVAVIAAPTLVVVPILLYVSPWNPIAFIDLTPLGLALGGALLGRGVIDSGALDAVPRLRYRLVEQLGDPVVVIDRRGRIADINAAGQQLFASDGDLVGRQLDTVFESDRLPLPEADRSEIAEVRLGERAYHVRAAAISARSGHVPHTALVFRDITDRLAAEGALRDMQQELERLAHTDSLTGLYNRRYFMQRLLEDVARASRHRHALAVLLFDLDHFKAVNDRYGHAAGDAVLVAVADTVRRIKRTADVAARLGGEEFGLLLPDTTLGGAWRLAERLRLAIAEVRNPGADDVAISITTSIGITALRPGDDVEALLNRADRALYAAKDGGRDAVRDPDSSPAPARIVHESVA